MGNYEQLKAAVASIVRDNGAEEITGNVLQSVLISIINSVGSGAVFAGIATPSTSPSNPDPNMFYIAVEAGTYPNFNLTVTTGMCIFSNESGTWVGHELNVSSQFNSGEYITEVSITDTLEGAETDNLPTVGAINGAVTALNTAITTERHDRQEADGNQTVALNLEKTLRQQGDEANSASVGYYVCDTAAATAAKAVNASGYVLRIGGNIRIEMTNANTADNATLNINSTGAKALYYDGAQASSTNTWEAGEVLEVYYDGTQYQCASGGGGKFASGESVKDVAITDIVTKDSDDLVTSGGVDGAFRGGTKTETYGSDDATVSGILKWDGTVGSYGGWYTSAKISVEGAKTLVATGLYYSSSTYMGLALYDANDNVIYRNTAADISLNMSSYPTASYMRFCRNSQTPSITLTIDYGLLSQVTSKTIVEGDNMPVSGGAVKRGFDAVNMELNGAETTYDTDDCTPNTILKANGTTQTFNNYYTSDFIAVSQDYVMYCTNLYANDGYYDGLHFYDDNKDSASVQLPSGSIGYIDFADYPTVKYIRFCGQSGAEITLQYNNAIRPKLNEIYPTAKNLGMLFNLSDGTFGITEVVSGTRTLANNFPVVTAAHSASSMTGLLSKIKIKVNAAGKFKVGVGILDQNNIPVIRETLTVEAQYAGYNEIDTSSLNFIIKESEQLFIIYDGNLSSVKPQYMQTNNSAYAEDNCPYGTLSGLSYYGVSGIYIVFTLAYDVVEINSVFAMKSQIEELQQELTSVQQNSIIWDEDGIPYRLRVENGVVVPVAQVFRKVVILGNSLTWHEYNASIGWYGKNRSMASTTNDTSWPYMFERILKKKQPTATVTGVMMRNWETAGDGNRNINNIPSTKALLDAALAADVDLIIFRCGENGTVSSATTYAQEIKSLIDYCLNTATNAQVVLCGLFWPNATKDEAILSVANNYHYQYITAGNAFGSNQEINGDYMVDSEDGQQKRIGSACLSHTNDYGFYMWTNHIASQLGYGNEQLDELYEVNISSTLSNPYRIKTTKSPYKSLVTILVQESSQPTVSVTAGGTSVQTTIHELTNAGAFTFAITFIQPESDVNVILS